MLDFNGRQVGSMPGERSSAPSSQMIETAAGLLEVVSFGRENGAPLVLVSHGMGSWESLLEIGQHVLANDPGRKIIAWSRPGRGRSPAAVNIENIDPLIHEAGIVLPALLSALGITTADFLGHSDGATVALIFAALFPERAGRIAAIAPYAFADTHFDAATAELPATERESGLSDRLGAHHDNPQALYLAWTDHRRTHAMQRWSALDLFEGVAVPLLLIQGMDDEFASPVQLSAIAGVVSGPVKWVMLHGEGHFPQHDNPEQIFRLVEAHIDPVRSAAPRHATHCTASVA